MFATWTSRVFHSCGLSRDRTSFFHARSTPRRIGSSPPESKTPAVTETVVLKESPTELDALPVGFIDTGEVVPHRWILTVAMSLAFVLCNMDKVNMSVAVIPMAKELGWSATARGLVQSSFFWGYTLTQVPAGWMSTRIGGEKVLFAGVLLWSLGTFIAPSAAHVGFSFLCLSRVLVRGVCFFTGLELS